jgi:carboxyl-terminal processing protease
MRKILLPIGLAASIIAGSFTALPHSAMAQSSQDAETFRQLELFGDIFERVRSFYVDETVDKALIEEAINGMLASLDPHSNYLNEESYRDMQVQTRGEFGGLGIEVTMDQGLIRVIAPIDETPAARAGVQAGDFITHIDGIPILGMNLNEAIDLMRGPVNTDIEISISREGVDPFNVVLVRDVIRIQSVRSRVLGDVAYVRVTSFNEQAEEGLIREIGEMRAEIGDDMKGLVVDLRNNPGGLLDQAVKISDAFLDQGEIVSTKARSEGGDSRYNATVGDLADGLPVVVLINGGSASASEIVAGALQDHHRAVIMGTQSFGKGSVQTIVPIPGHGAMRLTTARYYTPSGISIQGTGISPDILVEQVNIEAVDQPGGLREEDLRNALENPGDVPVVEGDQSHGRELAPEDYQLSRAIDMIHGIALANLFRPQTATE